MLNIRSLAHCGSLPRTPPAKAVVSAAVPSDDFWIWRRLDQVQHENAEESYVAAVVSGRVVVYVRICQLVDQHVHERSEQLVDE